MHCNGHLPSAVDSHGVRTLRILKLDFMRAWLAQDICLCQRKYLLDLANGSQVGILGMTSWEGCLQLCLIVHCCHGSPYYIILRSLLMLKLRSFLYQAS
jgi:hypothetical protein